MIETIDTRLGLAGRVAVVLGGTRGLGLAAASKLCDCGVHVTVTYADSYVDAERAWDVLGGRAGSVTITRADVRDEDATNAVLESRDRLDIVVHAAAGHGFRPGGRLAKLMAPGGRVIVVQGDRALVQVLEQELAPWQITVNAVTAARLDRGPLNMNPELIAELAAGTSAGRLTVPEDVANTVALLCTDEAAWIRGQVIEV